MKKGQAAMEYLMTYGWAIIIIIVAVAALYAMGVFKIGTTVTCSPCFGTQFTYGDYSNGMLLITNGPQQINITNVVGANMPTQTFYDPGDDITLTGISTTGDVDVTITYDVIGGLSGHTESGTIHN